MSRHIRASVKSSLLKRSSRLDVKYSAEKRIHLKVALIFYVFNKRASDIDFRNPSELIVSFSARTLTSSYKHTRAVDDEGSEIDRHRR